MKRTIMIALLLLAFGLAAYKAALDKEAEEAAVVTFKQEKASESFRLEVSAEEFRKSLLRIYPDLTLEGSPSAWLGERRRSEGIIIGGQEISERAMSQIFLLGSCDFTLRWTGEEFMFEVDKSYGEG